MPTDASVYVPVETLTGFMIEALVKMGSRRTTPASWPRSCWPRTCAA
jgi:hypothetical protein